MQAEEILERVKAREDLPHGWIVFPLLRDRVTWAIAGWCVGILMGLGLFAFVASVVIPYNYQRGPGPAILTTLLLAILLSVGLGSIWALIIDIRRLLQADRHLLVLTPEDFVKQEAHKIVHVPCADIHHVTARGTRSHDRTASSDGNVRGVASAGEGVSSFLWGRLFTSAGSRTGTTSRPRTTRRRTPSTLAFIDTRTNQEVVVVDDKAYGDPFVIGNLLKQYAADAQQIYQ